VLFRECSSLFRKCSTNRGTHPRGLGGCTRGEVSGLGMVVWLLDWVDRPYPGFDFQNSNELLFIVYIYIL
jgi:hypothetical protein